MKIFIIGIESALIGIAVRQLLEIVFEGLGFIDFTYSITKVAVCIAIAYQLNNFRKELL